MRNPASASSLFSPHRQTERYRARLLEKLTPAEMQTALLRAGAILIAYELVKAEILDKVRSFVTHELDLPLSEEAQRRYEADVLSKDLKSKYRASCAWLSEVGAVDAGHIAILEDLYAHRKEIAHQLPTLLLDPDFDVRIDLLSDALECLRVFGQFWGGIEVDSDSRFDGRDIRPESIKSGASVFMEYLVDSVGV